MNLPKMTLSQIEQVVREQGFKSLDPFKFAHAIVAARDAQWQAALAEQEPVAWRPVITTWPCSWSTGKPDQTTRDYWRDQDVEIEYAYAHPPMQQEAAQPEPSTPAAQERAEPVAPAVGEPVSVASIMHYHYAVIAGELNRKEMEQGIAALLSATPSAPAQPSPEADAPIYVPTACEACDKIEDGNPWGWCEFHTKPEAGRPRFATLPPASAAGEREESIPVCEFQRCAQWIRDHYQDHATIDGLCAAMIAALATKQQAEQEATPPAQTVQDSVQEFADDPELTVEAFANRLAEFMKRGSLTAKDVNEITGVSESTLSRLKNHGRMPDAISYAALCNMMGWHPYLKHKIAAGRQRAARTRGDEVGKSS